MQKQELEFLEQNILTLAKSNGLISIDLILDYLDYINKVKYKKEEIIHILEKLVAEDKLNHINDSYSLKL